MADVRLKAADLLLDRGVRFRLPASFVSKLFGGGKLDIPPLKAGTILEFSRIVISSELEETILKSDYTFLSKAIEPVAKCIAICILNDEQKIAERTEKLSRELLWKYPSGVLVEIYKVLAELNRVSDFISITRFLLDQMTMMMNPKNLGQEANGR